MTTRKTKGPTRAQATRWAGPGTGGYPSDLTDAQWQVIVPHLPAERPGRRGRPRIWPARRIVEAILYLDRTGCAWRYLPTDYPPWQTVYGYFAAWRDDGTLARLHGELRARARAAAGRKPQPTAAVIDSQSVRAADTVPKTTRGWDAAKKVNGRKRHIAVDTTGLVLDVVITAACVQDRDAARPLLWNTRRACRGVRLVWADAGYTGKLATWAAAMKMTLQIVAKRDPHAFEILPRRWVVERTFAWISKHRRTTRDYEHLPASHEAMILWAMIALMTRRLAQSSHLSDTHLVMWARASVTPSRSSCGGCVSKRSMSNVPSALLIPATLPHRCRPPAAGAAGRRWAGAESGQASMPARRRQWIPPGRRSLGAQPRRSQARSSRTSRS